MSDRKGARLMLKAPAAKAMIADRGYDSDWFRAALPARGTTPCIPPTKNRKTPLDYDNIAAPQDRESLRRLKDWRRIATRYEDPRLLLGDLHRSCRRVLSQSMSPYGVDAPSVAALVPKWGDLVPLGWRQLCRRLRSFD
jgi:transposase